MNYIDYQYSIDLLSVRSMNTQGNNTDLEQWFNKHMSGIPCAYLKRNDSLSGIILLPSQYVREIIWAEHIWWNIFVQLGRNTDSACLIYNEASTKTLQRETTTIETSRASGNDRFTWQQFYFKGIDVTGNFF